MKNVVKIFAAMLIMVAFVVTGCQSNEEKYTQLKNETIKTIETVVKESAKHEPFYEKKKKVKAEKYEKAFKIVDEKMPTIEKNVKTMEELAKKELKLSNDFQVFKNSYVKIVRSKHESYKYNLEKTKKEIANGVPDEIDYAERLNNSGLFKPYNFKK